MARQVVDVSQRVVVASRNALPQNFLANEGTLLYDFSDAGAWTNGGTAIGKSLTQSTLHNTVGTGSIKLATGVTIAANTFSSAVKVNQSMDLSNVSQFRLKVGYNQTGTYEARNTNSYITIILGNDNTYTNYYALSFNLDQLKNTDDVLVWEKSDMTVVGTPNWSSPFTLIDIRGPVTAAGVGNTLELYLDALYVDRRAKTKVVISFDDGINSVYTEAYLGTNLPSGRGMLARNMPGTCYLNMGLLNAGNTMTIAQVRELVNTGGWYVANHTWDHIDPRITTIAEYITSLDRNTEAMKAEGWHGDRHHAHPFGEFTSDIMALLAERGFKTSRLTRFANKYQPSTQRFGLVPTEFGLIDPYRLSTDAMSYGVTTAAGLLASVDSARKFGTSINLYGHGFVAVPTVSTQWALTELDTLLDGLELRRDLGYIDILNVDQWYNMLTYPRKIITTRTVV